MKKGHFSGTPFFDAHSKHDYANKKYIKLMIQFFLIGNVFKLNDEVALVENGIV